MMTHCVMGRIVDSEALPPGDLETDVVVVGTGAGGAVMAKELAERGVRVVALEEGGHHTARDFNRRPVDMMPLLYRDGGLTGSIGRPAVAIPLGKAVGGTTLINSGTCFRTPPNVLQSWEIDPAELDPYFEKVEKTIHATAVTPDLLGRNGHLMKRGVELLGLHGRPLRRNVLNCKGSGVCCFGCPTNAKQSTNLSYIPKAVAAGAEVVTHAKMERILVEKGRAAGVTFADRTVRAKALVLAAGALMTPILLQRNKLCLSSGQVGRNLTIHPCTRVLGVFPEVVEGWKGVPQGFYVDDYAEEGIMLEGIHGPPSLVAVGLPFLGEKLMRVLENIRYVAAFGVLTHDAGTGRVSWSRLLKTPIVRYSLQEADVERLRKGMALAARAFLAAGAERIIFPIHGWEEISDRAALERFLRAKLLATDFELAAFHPLGTCRMGRDPRTSVVDMYGAAHDLPGLWISDGSIFPSALGVNPQVTIMAFATRAADALAKSLGRTV